MHRLSVEARMVSCSHRRVGPSTSVWDDILQNIRIVISTHQVLLDALTHGFVTMRRIALLIFDEGESHILAFIRPEPN